MSDKQPCPNLVWGYINTPLGQLAISADSQSIHSVEFTDQRLSAETANSLIKKAKKQLTEYFAGTRRKFTLPLAPVGTEFQQQVWQALLQVPYGQTSNYRAIARQVDNPRAFRAVGSANRKNPIAIIVPCHRIIGTGGHLMGYAGGLNRKAWLLQLESQQVQKPNKPINV
jgi:methylated-DNA-[protein]-cysteine S-methyltransferase